MNAVELHNVYQQYGSMAVLDNISLSLAEGEVLGLFGHNGAGKTTTVRLILGLLQATTGEVRVLGFLPENVTFYPQLTGRETLLHFARLKGAAVQQVDDLLEQVGLTAASSKRVKTYSKGMRQRLGLAQALLGRPRLLLLDEPTVGLDPIATQELYQVIGRLRDEGTSIVICSHVLPGVEPYIDRAAVLALGRLEAVGTLHELRSQAQLPVRIRAAGLTVAQLSAPEVQAIRPLHGVWHELLVAPMDKLATVQRILQLQPQDLEVQPPSLEDLYCYYMEQAGALGVAGVQQ